MIINKCMSFEHLQAVISLYCGKGIFPLVEELFLLEKKFIMQVNEINIEIYLASACYMNKH